jgi:predicted ATPase
MKKLFFAIFALIMTTQLFAAGINSENLVGKWEFKDAILDVKEDRTEEEIKKDEMALELIRGIMSQFSLDFKANGYCLTNDGKKQETGKWELNGSDLKVTGETSVVLEMNIYKLTAEEMIWSKKGAPANQGRMIFQKAKPRSAIHD